ncbi:hypothetical protein [Spiroplasma endosymbiont of Nebria brevicollis]|uniref:hypothetical protein n=1 Tax=Spiroplasma endosymbiont of Nebria brevicollis TaxID=3066284 RepID=UPI00313AF935
MKSMKTIIRLLGAVVLTTASLTTVVACGNKARTLQNDVDDIITALKSGVQGKDLTSGTSTQKDALDLFQAAADFINKDAIVTLAVPADATTPLVKGDSTIQVIITLKTIISSINEANIVGVK